MTTPEVGDLVLYQTDGRNGLDYALPAIVTVTRDSHPGDYPTGEPNPLPVPSSFDHVHLTVFTPGGFGTTLVARDADGGEVTRDEPLSEEFPGAEGFTPGSGTYVELDVKHDRGGSPRSWRRVSEQSL